MAAKSKGSIILEILVVVMALLLIAVILIPNQIWEEEAEITQECRQNMNILYESEAFIFRTTEAYTDSLSKLLTFVQSDSGLKQRQTVVSLTRSLVQVLNNILEIPSISEISSISQSAFEITGDLVGNERYFRDHPELLQTSKELVREIMRMDSSAAFPNFSRTKLFVDSLRNLKDRVSEYSLQTGISNAISYTDSINLYFAKVNKDAFTDYWQQESNKIRNFIASIRQTDIGTKSSVADRLDKFTDRVDNSVSQLEQIDISQSQQRIAAEKQNLAELHQKFLAPDFFILTKRYGMGSLNETDSILIDFSQNDFYCPDNNEPYLLDTTGNRITVHCPNLLDEFQERFQEDVEPIRNLPAFEGIGQIDTVIARTRRALDNNRTLVRRNTDLLLKVKEIEAEFNDLENVYFYRYAAAVKAFVELVQNEKKLSVLKPAIEDILNPMDTLAARIEKKDIQDLREKLEQYGDQLSSLDSAIAGYRLSRRDREKVNTLADTFRTASQILDNIDNRFDDSQAEALREASDELEDDLLEALEGVDEPVYLIFNRTHINHGFIRNGEMSWEE
ncbi:MAG: hypothetical protein WAN36_03035 [Calditrichia bacterium]